MNTQNAVAHSLPLLRRYARALVGDQRSGDDLVCAALDGMIRDGRIGSAADQRLELYRSLSAHWNDSRCEHALARSADTIDLGQGLDRRLRSLTSMSRQVFLLVSMESFTPGEVASILELTSDQFETALTRARREVASLVRTDVLIIEDELFIAADLEDILTSLGHRIIAVERTHADAVRASRSAKPGIVLADIQLADGSSGIEAVNEILHKWAVPVIFITAYPERLITGLRPEPTLLLTKPFKIGDVRAAVSQALFFEASAQSGSEPAQQSIAISKRACPIVTTRYSSAWAIKPSARQFS